MTEKKMNPKVDVSGGVSLDAFIGGADPVSEPKKRPVARPKVQKQADVPSEPKGARGRPNMPPQELKNKVVQVKLTEKEFEELRKQAGRVPLSVFLRDEMKSNGIL